MIASGFTDLGFDVDIGPLFSVGTIYPLTIYRSILINHSSILQLLYAYIYPLSSRHQLKLLNKLLTLMSMLLVSAL